MKNPSHSSSNFVDLTAFQSIQATPSAATSSVIKAGAIRNAGVATIQILDGEPGTPTIQVQREGEKIRQIEFVCTCGKTAHLDLQYDEE